jgi:hypothetical protein
MTKADLAKLEAIALDRMEAHRYPDDHHRFRPFRCKSCGPVPLILTIEHHTGSRQADFKGLIFARCTECEAEDRVFGYTGSHRKPLRRTIPRCKCGSEQFYAAECERIEGGGGLAGFFDEGIVVGICSQCGRPQAFVFTD